MTRRFGWCLDNRHDVCRHRALNLPHDLSTITCGCDCHVEAAVSFDAHAESALRMLGARGVQR